MGSTSQKVLKKLRRLEALREGASTDGERAAAEAARQRLVDRLEADGVHIAPELRGEESTVPPSDSQPDAPVEATLDMAEPAAPVKTPPYGTPIPTAPKTPPYGTPVAQSPKTPPYGTPIPGKTPPYGVPIQGKTPPYGVPIQGKTPPYGTPIPGDPQASGTFGTWSGNYSTPPSGARSQRPKKKKVEKEEQRTSKRKLILAAVALFGGLEVLTLMIGTDPTMEQRTRAAEIGSSEEARAYRKRRMARATRDCASRGGDACIEIGEQIVAEQGLGARESSSKSDACAGGNKAACAGIGATFSKSKKNQKKTKKTAKEEPGWFDELLCGIGFADCPKSR